MKRMVIASLVAAQLVAVQPLAAAQLIEDRVAAPERGGFVGARLRLPLGTSDARPRLGLAAASMTRSRETGALGMAAGVELGVSAAGSFQLAAGGRTIAMDQQKRAGVSTLGWVAIGVGTLLVVTAIAAASFAELIECDDDEECN